MENEVHSYYGNHLRIRVCGLCVRHDKLLLINHSGITDGNFWSPPGGGLNFGETVHESLKREFREETRIEINIGKLLFVCEFLNSPLHAIELFFEVIPQSHNLKKGSDPEPNSPKIIKEVKFLSWEEIKSIPAKELHGSFKFVKHPSEILLLQGYFKI